MATPHKGSNTKGGKGESLGGLVCGAWHPPTLPCLATCWVFLSRHLVVSIWPWTTMGANPRTGSQVTHTVQRAVQCQGSSTSWLWDDGTDGSVLDAEHFLVFNDFDLHHTADHGGSSVLRMTIGRSSGSSSLFSVFERL